MEIMVNTRCWDDSSHTLGLWDSAEPGVESKGETRVTFLGMADLVKKMGSGPQGTELGCLPLTLIPGPEEVEGSVFKVPVCLWGITICCKWHLPLLSSCYFLWTPDSVQKAVVIFFTKKKNVSQSTCRTPSRPQKLLLFAFKPLLFP